VNEPIVEDNLDSRYEAPRVLATFTAHEILAEAETSSVVIIVS
jgi:hypothetical protein